MVRVMLALVALCWGVGTAGAQSDPQPTCTNDRSKSIPLSWLCRQGLI